MRNDLPTPVILDPRFKALIVGHAKLEHLGTGYRWSEGPAYFPAGRYLIWSDVPSDRMMRFDETDGSVSVFRQPSNNSNGNTVDGQGRLITCEHLTRRVTRTEHDGSITVLADRSTFSSRMIFTSLEMFIAIENGFLVAAGNGTQMPPLVWSSPINRPPSVATSARAPALVSASAISTVVLSAPPALRSGMIWRIVRPRSGLGAEAGVVGEVEKTIVRLQTAFGYRWLKTIRQETRLRET